MLTSGALLVERRSPKRLPAIAALALIPICFIAVNTGPSLSLDFNYILSPALRLLDGTPPREIYFQYDLLPSLLAGLWMQLGLELNTIRLLGQAAYYLAILAVFLLARQLFLDRNLAVLLLVALVVGRLYTSVGDVLCCFQVTPLRLDLWVPLAAVVYLRGAWHWLTGLTCGLLLLLVNKFGILYSLAYLQLLLVLFALDLADKLPQVPKRTFIRGSLLRAAPPIALVLT